MKEYLLKKEYIYLYVARFCYSLANSLIDIYGTVLLYKNGFSVAEIFIIYGLRFGVMGLGTPLFLVFATRLGIGFTNVIANVGRIALSYVILFNATDNILLLILLLAIPGAVSNPVAMVQSSYYVDTQYRGKYNSIRNICKIAGAACASIVILYGISTHQTMFLFLAVSGFLILDSFFTNLNSFKPQKSSRNAFKETLSYIAKAPDSLKLINACKSFHIAEKLFIPLYLFLALQDFVLFSAVISISLGTQIVVMLLCGYQTDKNPLRMNGIISSVRVIISTIFLFARNKIVISLNKTAYDNMEQIYDMVHQTLLENTIKIRETEPAVLASVCEMCLCFSEVIFFSLFALAAVCSVNYAFSLIFAGSIIATITINYQFRKIMG